MVRQGAIDSPPKCPFILGFECAGEIEQLGEGVEGLAVGDRVIALPEFRAWAELVAVPSKYVFKLPNSINFLDAAAMTMNYTVAYILLFELAGLTKGKSVLVHSIGGECETGLGDGRIRILDFVGRGGDMKHMEQNVAPTGVSTIDRVSSADDDSKGLFNGVCGVL
ncbi:hypothetical protein WA026_018322 [Henosepilachna vigintioctopunctata]|uniref:Enoyl reductase (ER) domain-containing protein n=1 Tax=Henosepilachna vigintioctopunctata TaxID=420089 RepID=A0AAW1VFA4_9CUCU